MLGTLCLKNMFWINKLARAIASIKLTVRINTACFVSLSTTIRMFV